MKKFLLILTCLLGFSAAAWAKAELQRLESIGAIEDGALYVLGIEGNGMHKSGTSNWGVCSNNETEWLKYTLVKSNDGQSFKAYTTINNTVYYLQIHPTTNTFSMTTKGTDNNTDIVLGTTTTDSKGSPSFAVTHATTTTRHLRKNGNNGLRSYAGTTGDMAYFYKIVEAAADPYTVTLNAGAGACSQTSITETAAGAGVTLPAATINLAGWSFAGWATTVCTETNTKPTVIPAGTYYPEQNITLHAVYSFVEDTETDNFYLSLEKGNTTYYAGTRNGSNSYCNAPTDIASAAVYGIEINNNKKYLYYQVGDSKTYVYISGNNTSLNFAESITTTVKDWTVEESNGTISFKTTASGTRNFALNPTTNPARFAAYAGGSNYPYQFTMTPAVTVIYNTNPLPTAENYTFHNENLTPAHDTNHIAKDEDGNWAANHIEIADGTDHTLPVDVNAAKVTYLRELTSDKWAAICLPFAVSTNDLADYDVLQLTSVTSDAVVFEYVTQMADHTPYLIKRKEEDATQGYNVAFDIEITGGTIVKAASDDATKTIAGAKMVGVYKATVMENGWYALAGGEFRRAYNNTNALKAFRAYLVLTAPTTSESMCVKVDGDDVTGIESIEVESLEGSFYDMQGRKVEHPTQGVYILNGKKVMIK